MSPRHQKFLWPGWSYKEWQMENGPSRFIEDVFIVADGYAEYRHPDRTLVYVIQCSATGRYKIGRTRNDIKKRMLGIQASCASELVLWGCLTVEEREAHKALMPYRVHGEWFEPTEAVESYIDQKIFRTTEIGVVERENFPLTDILNPSWWRNAA